jgi:hypothetical protein
MKVMAMCLLSGVFLCSAGRLESASRTTATIYGVGNHSCGKWLALPRDDDDWFIHISWVSGWLSAAGHYDVHGSLSETDSDAIAAWMDNYCRQHPLKSIDDAAAGLVRELAKPKE